jgi:hypothetical protein
MASYVRRGDALLEYFDFEPGAWAEVLERHLNSVTDFLSDGEIRPVDLEQAGSPDGWDTLRVLARDYGRLVAQWPVLIRAAREAEKRNL